jgi:hypothetical protein
MVSFQLAVKRLAIGLQAQSRQRKIVGEQRTSEAGQQKGQQVRWPCSAERLLRNVAR